MMILYTHEGDLGRSVRLQLQLGATEGIWASEAADGVFISASAYVTLCLPLFFHLSHKKPAAFERIRRGRSLRKRQSLVETEIC